MSRWIVAVDLGQTIDPTAISVMEITTRRELVEQHYSANPGDPPPLSWFRSGGDGSLKEPCTPARIDVRHLERLPLRTDYTAQVARIKKILRQPPLPAATELVVDQTGVGRPVVEMFRREGLRPIGVTITGGDGETRLPGSEWRVAKLLLVSRLQAALHSGELRIAKSLPEARTLAHELQEFRAQFTPTGYARFGAREGQHDDLVLALAIGTWWGSRGQAGRVSVGSLHI